jgi:hypothetical protein
MKIRVPLNEGKLLGEQLSASKEELLYCVYHTKAKSHVSLETADLNFALQQGNTSKTAVRRVT